MSTILRVEQVTHAYGKTAVLHGIDFGLESGAIGCLLGRSGCGKTTTLRAIAGFEPTTGGQIFIGDECVNKPGWFLPPEKRRIGIVFQDYALFPHLNIAGNIAFGLRGWQKADKKQRVEELLDLVGLPDAGRKFPHQLSGGQQQRIALARALAPNPRLILLDEPFSNLDTELREHLSLQLRDILKKAGMSALLVTHNQQEAFAIADVIGVMDCGRLRQWAGPHQLYHAPKDPFVATFVGEGDLVEAEWEAPGRAKTPFGSIEIDLKDEHRAQLQVLLRPTDILYDKAHSEGPYRVTAIHFRGESTLCRLQTQDGVQVKTLIPGVPDLQVGQSIQVHLAPKVYNAFPSP